MPTFLLAKIQAENESIKIKIIEGKKRNMVNKEIIIDKIGRSLTIPVSEKLVGITTVGLEYVTKNEELIFGSTRGISM